MRKGGYKLNSLFQGFINAIKAKITPIWTKIRLLFNPSYLKGEVLRRLIQYFRNLTDIRPKDKHDYYSVFGWLISKRLAFLIVITIGMLSAFYMTVVQPISVFSSSENGVKTYRYDSIPLRFTDGKVKILAKSEYVAYEGDVKAGAANGMGILYRKDGSVVYEGQFENSEFHGQGTSYFPNGQVQYVGAFQHNIYSGQGKLHRENGSLEYEGAFIDGKKEGAGILYDSGNNKTYVGNFIQGELLYSDFLGKSTAEANDIYLGDRVVYIDEEYFVVEMTDIDAVYYGMQAKENIQDEVVIEGVYVLKNALVHGGKELKNIAEIKAVMGESIYEGNTYVIMPEAVAIHIMNRSGEGEFPEIIGSWEYYFTDAVNVSDFDDGYILYIYTYVYDGMRYTFFCNDRSGEFSMYSIEKE